MARRALDGEVGEDLSDDRAELVAVPGEAGGDDGRRGVRVPVDEEVLVGRRLEEAGLERDGRARARGEVALGEGAERRLVGEGRVAFDAVRVATGSEVVVAAELESRDAVGREAVEVLAVQGEVEHGHAAGLEQLRRRRLQPGERLADASHHPCGEAGDVL